jgi:transposase
VSARRKLSPEQLGQLREQLRQRAVVLREFMRYANKRLAAEYGVHISTISRIEAELLKEGKS